MAWNVFSIVWRSPNIANSSSSKALCSSSFGHIARTVQLDLDLEGQGENSIARIKWLFSDIMSQAVEDDGLIFDPKSLRVARIKQEQEYEGLRVNLVARLERATIHMQVDVGFGDVIVPPPKDIHTRRC